MSVYVQLLEEMLDNGFPLITEPNALTSLVAPPNLGSRLVNYVTVRSARMVLALRRCSGGC